MKNKKKEADSKRHASARATLNVKTHARTAKYKVKNVKTSFTSKPMFDPIAGP